MSLVFDALRLGAVALDVVAAAQATPEAIARRQQGRLAALPGAALKGLPCMRVVSELGHPIPRGRSGKLQRVVARSGRAIRDAAT